MTSNVRIVSDGTGLGTRIEVDGVEVTGVTGLDFSLEAGGVATAVLRVFGAQLDAELTEVTITKTNEETSTP